MKTLIHDYNKISEISTKPDVSSAFIDNGIIERLHGDTYTCIDYSDDDSFLELEYKNGNFKIERTNLVLTEEQIDIVYKMLLDFIESEKEPSFDTETPFHPYNQAI